jgi:polysaccharide deacetylase family protein (PEP-CTERM system associated)
MHVLTFDVEDWFHILDNASTRNEADWPRYESRIEGNVDRILACLARQDQKATFFCLGWVARHHPGVIKAICSAGHTLGSHSDMHQLAYEQAPGEFEQDLRRSLDALQQISGQRVRVFRAPGFSITFRNLWAFEVLRRASIEVDCSIFPAPRAHGGLPKAPIREPAILETRAGPLKLFPMSVLRRLGLSVAFSGGGYFRLMPAPLLNQLFRCSGYVMTYFHPRDFDPDQPLLRDLSLVRRFKSYVGLRGALKKLERLLGCIEFFDLEEAEARVNWASVKRFRISDACLISA